MIGRKKQGTAEKRGAMGHFTDAYYLKKLDSALAKGDWEKAAGAVERSKSLKVARPAAEAAIEAGRWDELGNMMGRAERRSEEVGGYLRKQFSRAKPSDVERFRKDADVLLNFARYGNEDTTSAAEKAAAGEKEMGHVATSLAAWRREAGKKGEPRKR
ncbi:MAG: hypothetical protein PHF51_00215 [Candidatus ainarchaeum sp.]|nr:hypothetical protein [Candidatus ainarchaeum sp.]